MRLISTLIILFSGLLTLTFTSCQSEEGAVDVSKVSVQLQYIPFYKEFSAMDSNTVAQGLVQLEAKYPDFLSFYIDTLLPFGRIEKPYTDAEHIVPIRNIFVHKDFRALNDTVNQVFPDTKKYDEGILDAFKHIKYYLPNIALPNKVIYFTSCLNKWTCFTNNDQLGVGLDMFLGQGFRPYQAIGLPEYALINHTPENIPVWAAKAVYNNVYEHDNFNKSLLDLMLLNGKEVYYLNKVLPKKPLSLLLGYTPEQFKWCEANEPLIYNFFLKDNLLYSKNYQDIMRYVAPAPNSAGFPAEAPGNISTYIGYKIIKAYAAKTGKDLPAILNETNLMSLFQASKYKP
ncbi:hypothetical protein DBR32_06480 [Taibaiella sp. KBW10]|uniref:gliding motility lipoprotein GldB n=1 Tax=Taibaiella sp. KBW10 TaxID=2153357 RepID=UPI000F5B592D|nr:hypothetical protein [Taibaiella sp. KBW10]RQO31596.1 hypothetical protein DBR32_06480 [Taibaiella sp. KBW10]